MTLAELNREVERRQRALASKEDLAPYAGEWVVLREGRVVAHSHDPSELRGDDGVRPDDLIVLVDDLKGGYFL